MTDENAPVNNISNGNGKTVIISNSTCDKDRVSL